MPTHDRKPIRATPPQGRPCAINWPDGSRSTGMFVERAGMRHAEVHRDDWTPGEESPVMRIPIAWLEFSAGRVQGSGIGDQGPNTPFGDRS